MKEVIVGEENHTEQDRIGYQQFFFSETSAVRFQDVNGKYLRK